MKPLKLVPAQKHNLLMMCEKLFPEYCIHFTDDGFNDNCLIVRKKDIEIWGTEDLTFVPWFEFCIKFIYPKLIQLLNTPEWEFNLLGAIYEENHIIDYFYKEFLNIKT